MKKMFRLVIKNFFFKLLILEDLLTFWLKISSTIFIFLSVFFVLTYSFLIFHFKICLSLFSMPLCLFVHISCLFLYCQ
jgi:hypothetical protein